MTKFQIRRAAGLWLPTISIGAIVQIISYRHTLTMNGLTLIGMLIMSAGIIVIARDFDRTRTDETVWGDKE